MTVTQASTRLKVSTVRVRQLIAAGKLRAVKHGSQWWVLEPSVDGLVRRPAGRPVKVIQHVLCSICGECIDCNLRACRDGGEHTPTLDPQPQM